MTTRPDVQAQRDQKRATSRTERIKALEKAAEYEERAKRCRRMAQQLMDEAHAASTEALILRLLNR